MHARRACWRFRQDGRKLLSVAGHCGGADGDVEGAHGPLDQKQGRGDDTGGPAQESHDNSLQNAFDSEGQNCQDMCTLLGEAVHFLTDNVSSAPQELISNFQTLVEDQAQKFIVFQLKTVEAATGFRADGEHGHVAQAKADLGWISKLVQVTLLALSHGSVGH